MAGLSERIYLLQKRRCKKSLLIQTAVCGGATRNSPGNLVPLPNAHTGEVCFCFYVFIPIYLHIYVIPLSSKINLLLCLRSENTGEEWLSDLRYVETQLQAVHGCPSLLSAQMLNSLKVNNKVEIVLFCLL